MRGGGRHAVIAGAAVSPLLLLVVWLCLPSVAFPVASAVHAASVLVAGSAMVLAARSGDQRLRRPRLWFAAGLAASAFGFVLAGIYSATLGYVPIPSLGDAAALAYVPCAVAGMLALPSREHREGGGPRALLDALTTSCALALLFWLLFLEPIYSRSERTGLAKGVLLAYPAVDLVLTVIALAVTAHVRADVRRFLRFATIGLLLIAVQDAGAAVHLATGFSGFSWTNLVLQAGLATLIFAAVLPTSSEARESGRIAAAVDATLPHLPVVAVVLVGPLRVLDGHRLGFAEIGLGCLMILGLVARQVLYASHLAAVACRLSHDATQDSLTGLANRRTFLTSLEGALAEVEPSRIALVLLDLDGFKEINDSFGHGAGDVALAEFARRMQAAAGPGALPARLGGDEFAVLLTGDEVAVRALHLSDTLTCSAGATIGAVTVTVGASAGIALGRAGDTTSTILRRGDLAMYDAKRHGQSRAALFTDDMAARAERRHLLAQALPGSAERGELTLLYQPMVRLADGTVAGAEALLRWSHPLHGDVSPMEFVPLAEETGVIDEIGMWVLQHAAQQLQDWRKAGRSLPRLSVNVSPRQLTDRFAAQAVDVVRSCGVEPTSLTLEITESALPGLQASRCLSQLREAGFSLAMDDFGAGFSSLAQLAVLPVDTLKLDREFLRGMSTANGRRIVEAFVPLARDLGLTTVAEGVEQSVEADILRRAGCELAQGYHFARPLPPLDLWAMLPVAGEPAAIPSMRAPHGSATASARTSG